MEMPRLYLEIRVVTMTGFWNGIQKVFYFILVGCIIMAVSGKVGEDAKYLVK
jgi:hypothetical protein